MSPPAHWERSGLDQPNLISLPIFYYFGPKQHGPVSCIPGQTSGSRSPRPGPVRPDHPNLIHVNLGLHFSAQKRAASLRNNWAEVLGSRLSRRPDPARFGSFQPNPHIQVLLKKIIFVFFVKRVRT